DDGDACRVFAEADSRRPRRNGDCLRRSTGTGGTVFILCSDVQGFSSRVAFAALLAVHGLLGHLFYGASVVCFWDFSRAVRYQSSISGGGCSVFPFVVLLELEGEQTWRSA